MSCFINFKWDGFLRRKSNVELELELDTPQYPVLCEIKLNGVMVGSGVTVSSEKEVHDFLDNLKRWIHSPAFNEGSLVSWLASNPCV
jgi:hypothetical protein